MAFKDDQQDQPLFEIPISRSARRTPSFDCFSDTQDQQSSISFAQFAPKVVVGIVPFCLGIGKHLVINTDHSVGAGQLGIIGHIPSAEAETNNYAALDNLDMVA